LPLLLIASLGGRIRDYDIMGVITEQRGNREADPPTTATRLTLLSLALPVVRSRWLQIPGGAYSTFADATLAA
jgi:hypothetical protein